MNAHSVVAALQSIHQTIDAACLRAGRQREGVEILAVSKTKPAPCVLMAAQAGQTTFGENRVQEARDKIPLVPHPGLRWHLIGPLQRNKVKFAVHLFHMIQSVDSLVLAQEIDQKMAPNTIMPILLQVNVGRESQKNGLPPEDVADTLKKMGSLPRVSVQGLMTVPPFTPNPEEARPYFRALARLAAEIQNMELPGISMQTLSMGMSHDYAVAVEEGATMVRIGSALFGERDVPY